jgi:membrane-bound lytic murein transglycosylase MltF
MQLLKNTGEDPNVDIPDIEKMEKNIHAGVKYLRFMSDRYFEKSQRISQTSSFVGYNAGPLRVSKLRKEAARQGLISMSGFVMWRLLPPSRSERDGAVCQ